MSISAVLKYKVLEKGGMAQIELTQYNEMKKEFYQMFTEKVFEDKDLVGMINFDEFLKNIQPFYKIMGTTNQIEIYNEDVDTFLFMKYIASMIFNLNKSMKSNTFKLLKQCLKYQVTNPLVYIMLFFSMLEKDLELFFRNFNCDELKKIKNSSIDDFLWNKISPREKEKSRDLRSHGPEIFNLLALFIQLVEEHFQMIVEMIKETSKVKVREQEFQRQAPVTPPVLQKQNTMREAIRTTPAVTKDMPQISEEDDSQGLHQMASPGLSRKRAYSEHFSPDSVAPKSDQQKDPLQQNGILSEHSLGIDSLAIDPDISSKFMKKNKIIYYLPNLYLGKSTLFLWINMLTKVISSRKRLKDLDSELRIIITSLKNIKYYLEEIIQNYKVLVRQTSDEVKELDSKINDMMSNLVTECDDANTVGELLNILSDLRHESFTRKLSE